MNNGPIEGYRFCLQVPDGDNRERQVCRECGWIHYVNPKIVVGAICVWRDRILICKRSIEPRSGYWTMPAGYLEERETPEDGAKREAIEEANARIDIEALLAVYSIPRISQVQLIYRARLLSPDVSPGEESEAVRLVSWDEIPWRDLAFPSVHWALRHYREVRQQDRFPPFANPPGETGDRIPSVNP